MIPAQTLRSVESSSVTASASFGISPADVAHILTMLRDTLYSDRILAVLREYGANAWDVHREVGRGDVPIRVTLPTMDAPTLEIRDYGTGISREDMLGRFLLAGASTKRGSNVAVGTLGIGRLSGFAYGDSFVVESRHGGVCSTYAAVIDASERGRVDLLDEQPAEDTGLAVRLAVRTGDVAEFREKAVRFFAHMQPQPEINAPLPAQGERVGDGVLLDSGGWVAVMGCVSYPIDLGQVGAADFVRDLSGVLYFDIGDLHFAASREALKYTDQTRRAVRGKLDAFLDEYVRGQIAAIESAISPWDKRVRSLALLRFPLPWLRLDETAPTRIGLPDFATLSLCTRDGKKKRKASAISVHRASRIIVRDDKRALSGFRFGDRDYLATPDKENTVDEAEVELGQAVASLGIDGIPVTRTSALPWIKPPTRERMGRGGVSTPRGRAFKLRSPSYRFSPPYSRHWESVRRDPEASDVYVVLDVFRNDEFYAAYRSDAAMRDALGLDPLPVVYGYKKGNAPTVGRTYVAWRETYIDAAAKLPRVRELLAQYAAHGLCDVAPSAAQLAEIETRLGAEHPIAVLCSRISTTHSMLHGVKCALRDLLAQTRAKSPALDDRALRRYPLLAAEGVEKLWDKNAAAWLDYVAGKKRASEVHDHE